jgi:hypothetical protein
MRTLVATLAAAVLAAAIAPQAARAEFGIVPGSFDVATLDAGGQPELRAGAHPDRFVARFEFVTEAGAADANVKDIVFDLPTGFSGDATAVPACPRGLLFTPGCPPESQIGVIRLTFVAFGQLEVPIYNVVPQGPHVAEFGSSVLIIPVRLLASLRADGDYGTRIELHDLLQNLPLLAGEVELWGVPADHQTGTAIPRRSFLRNATRCDDGPPTTTIRARSWQQPDAWVSATSAEPGPLTGCAELPFDPGLGVTLDSPVADSPTGALVELTFPQSNDADGPTTSHLKEAAVTLPEGLSLSPAVAEGLTACDDAQLGVGSTRPPACPESSKLGSVEISSPLLDQPMKGDLFFGRQLAANTYRLFITAAGPGFALKLRGSLQPDPLTGRLTTVLTDLPQLPVARLALRFKGGPRAPLATPPSCGTGTASAVLTPYRGGPVATVAVPVTIASGPGGGACASTLPFAPSFTAGSTPARAGGNGAFSLTVRRPDGDEPIERLRVPLPPGLSAHLADVARCPMPVATAAACSAASRVGSVVVEAGAGTSPFSLSGEVHLTGPYRDAPLGLALTLRALVGPLDLGTIVVPLALRFDPFDGQHTIATDALPTMLGGIPLRLQTIGVDVDRPGFMVNPTSCRKVQITATIRGAIAGIATPSAPYSLRGCRGLRFGPTISLALTGRRELRKGGHPELRIAMRQRAGDANARAVTVAMPRAVELNEDAVSAICSREQARDDRCPAGSRVGTARVRTPLLADPLTGPVYAVQPDGGGTPDLWAAVAGGGIRLMLRSVTVVRQGELRAKFVELPDLPMSAFTMRLGGARQGVVSVVERLCDRGRRRALVARAALRGQNDARASQVVPVRARPRCGR